MGKPLTRAEIEAKEGKYDEDGFYNLPDKSFYDPAGYFFNKDGYDEFGGYYDNHTGHYVPGSGFEDEYYRNYGGTAAPGDMLGYSLDDYDEEDYGAEDESDYKDQSEAFKQAVLMHVVPAEDWLKEQPKDKDHIVKLANVPELFNENNIKKFLSKRINDLKYSQLTLERDQRGRSLGVAWIKSNNQPTVAGLLHLHKKRFADYELRTYLMGFTYDNENEMEGHEDYDDEEEDYEAQF